MKKRTRNENLINFLVHAVSGVVDVKKVGQSVPANVEVLEIRHFGLTASVNSNLGLFHEPYSKGHLLKYPQNRKK
jgi:hypothetical protein